MQFLGIDTSNYTTSVALYDAGSNTVLSEKQLLPVKPGELGLRQSDAVFAHTKQIAALLRRVSGDGVVSALAGVGVSAFPCRSENSYMPCFLVGQAVAESVAAVNGLPVSYCSHQEGHILAAMYSAGVDEIPQNGCYAVHLSGGTTDCLLVTPNEEHLIEVQKLAGSLDLKAGQAVDRVGKMLGLPFPSGPALEALAAKCGDTIKVPKPSLKGLDCSLSGTENRCMKLKQENFPDSYIAKYCLLSVEAAVSGMVANVMREYGNRPVLFAGGVMSNRLLQQKLTETFTGWVAEPAFSSDNAVGCAIYAAKVGR